MEEERGGEGCWWEGGDGEGKGVGDREETERGRALVEERKGLSG